MIIRKIEIEDIESIYHLLNELYDGRIQYNIFTNKYKQCLIDDNFYGIVAEENNKILGVLISRLVNRLVKSKNILFIDDLIVSKNDRNKGIGKLLLQDATNYAMHKNCEAIELTSYLSNENSHKFYEKNGFEKKYYNFKKYLD